MFKLLFIIICCIVLISILVYLSIPKNNTILTRNSFKNIKEDYLYTIIDSHVEDIIIPAEFQDSFDWSTNNNQYNIPCLTPVKNQYKCGSCYAMVVTSLIESAIYRNNLPMNKELIILSAQQFIDCFSKDPTNPDFPCKGCSGCSEREVLENLYGRYSKICTENDYPYDIYQVKDIKDVKGNYKLYNYPGCLIDEKCGSNNFFKAITIPNYDTLKINLHENNLKKVLYKYGPLAWGINIPKNWGSTGIFTGKFPETAELGHAVFICGWGVKKNIFGKKEKYWIIQNSWGTDWANKGYLWIPRSDSGKYGPFGYNNISKDLFTLQISRPVCDSPSANIMKKTRTFTYLPNATQINFDIKANIINSTYKIQILLNSTEIGIFKVNNIINDMNEIIENNIKVVDNNLNYYCYDKSLIRPQIILDCNFKNWFYYESNIIIKNKVINDIKIIVNIFDKTNLSEPVYSINETFESDIIIEIINIDLQTNNISYKIIKNMEWSSMFGNKIIRLYNVKESNIIDNKENYVFEKEVSEFSISDIINISIENISYGIYQFFTSEHNFDDIYESISNAFEVSPDSSA
jgi:hypothetical protein